MCTATIIVVEYAYVYISVTSQVSTSTNIIGTGRRGGDDTRVREHNRKLYMMPTYAVIVGIYFFILKFSNSAELMKKFVKFYNIFEKINISTVFILNWKSMEKIKKEIFFLLLENLFEPFQCAYIYIVHESCWNWTRVDFSKPHKHLRIYRPHLNHYVMVKARVSHPYMDKIATFATDIFLHIKCAE